MTGQPKASGIPRRKRVIAKAIQWFGVVMMLGLAVACFGLAMDILLCQDSAVLSERDLAVRQGVLRGVRSDVHGTEFLVGRGGDVFRHQFQGRSDRGVREALRAHLKQRITVRYDPEPTDPPLRTPYFDVWSISSGGGEIITGYADRRRRAVEEDQARPFIAGMFIFGALFMLALAYATAWRRTVNWPPVPSETADPRAQLETVGYMYRRLLVVVGGRPYQAEYFGLGAGDHIHVDDQRVASAPLRAISVPPIEFSLGEHRCVATPLIRFAFWMRGFSVDRRGTRLRRWRGQDTSGPRATEPGVNAGSERAGARCQGPFRSVFGVDSTDHDSTLIDAAMRGWYKYGFVTIPLPMRFEGERMLWTVDDVYSADECNAFIEMIESESPSLATNNPIYRDQDRVMRDDPATAADLFTRLQPHLPAQIGDFTLIGLNDRLRFYRYREGQQFAPHMDHWYRPSDTRITLHTVLVYFNADFEGGQTRFMEQLDACVVPEPGRVAIFQHKLRHAGEEVIRGTKYAMRTDAIYEAPEPVGRVSL